VTRQLLATSALVAAGLLTGTGPAFAQANGPAQKSRPTLTINGWVEGIVGTSNQDTSIVGTRVGWDSQWDSEFHFNGAVTLDNGIQIKTRAELEGEVSGDQWDEVYMTIGGGFGELRIGSMDNAAYQMLAPISGSWGVQVGQSLGDWTTQWLSRPAGHGPDENVRLNIGDTDSNKINYFTPRIAGFQLALSYLPSFEECVTSGASQNAQCNSSIASVSTFPHNGWAAGFSFDRTFDRLRTALGIGYMTAKKPKDLQIAGRERQSGDPKGVQYSALLSYDGFSLAGSYKQEHNVIAAAGFETDERVSDIAAAYEWGRNAVSVAWLHSRSPASLTIQGDDKTDVIAASYRRELGPGVQYRLNVWHADFRGENPGSTDDNSGCAISTSIRITF
jgi:hypothetical protein